MQVTQLMSNNSFSMLKMAKPFNLCWDWDIADLRLFFNNFNIGAAEKFIRKTISKLILNFGARSMFMSQRFQFHFHLCISGYAVGCWKLAPMAAGLQAQGSSNQCSSHGVASIGLNSYNLSIKQSFNKILEVTKASKSFRFMTQQINPCKFTEVINETHIKIISTNQSWCRFPHIRKTTSRGWLDTLRTGARIE